MDEKGEPGAAAAGSGGSGRPSINTGGDSSSGRPSLHSSVDNSSGASSINLGGDGAYELPLLRPRAAAAADVGGWGGGGGEKRVISEDDAYEVLGFVWPAWKKWSVIGVIFMVQTSMNLNTSIYGNAIGGISEAFGVSEAEARVGQMVFLIAYAFGSELWAPWSEEFGRWPVLQLSLFFVNAWQVLCALSPSFAGIVVGRGLGGLSSAGGSVTLGMVADLWSADEQQYAVAFIVLSSVAGSVVGPVVGGFVETYMHWRWVFWLQLLFGAVAQAVHFATPETRVSVLLTREAKRRREAGLERDVYGPDEVRPPLSRHDIVTIWVRPFHMFVTEPIVLFLSLLSGFSDALIFTFLEGYPPVYAQWGFNKWQTGLAFLPLLVGYVLAWLSFLPWIRRDRRIRRADPDALQPESRLYWLLYTAPLETIGLFGFAWTSLGPPQVHWIAPMLFSVLIAMANYAIYMATIDYMVASYGEYSASATGGNAFARDFLAGIAAVYSTPMYSNIGDRYRLEWPSTILGVISIFVIAPVYLFYWKGPAIRARSRFAQVLESDRKAHRDVRQAHMKEAAADASSRVPKARAAHAPQLEHAELA